MNSSLLTRKTVQNPDSSCSSASFSMQKDFDEKSDGMSDAEKERLFADMQLQFNQKRLSIEKEAEDQVTNAVKSVASKRGLSLVVDKAAVIYGGTEITKDVSDS